MNSYKCLAQQEFSSGEFKIVPIRFEDRMDIMKWRNEQMYHLRQAEPLTIESQNHYFNSVVKSLFEQEKPSQILFSFLQNDICIGYGGLVHINWIDKNVEISFIMNTDYEKENFETLWSEYLNLIEQVAFNELQLYKLYVYAFDLRPHLYTTLLNNNYFFDARLKEHCFFENSYKDVIIHSKITNL
ncbi:GNAT family N-acetyltransferase [Nonlabens sp.]|uniref:GNAT family N-acetyltransferase n=1 Tax=Nonlabens sp. TaxID=1888209 RepID=UPI003F6971F1